MKEKDRDLLQKYRRAFRALHGRDPLTMAVIGRGGWYRINGEAIPAVRLVGLIGALNLAAEIRDAKRQDPQRGTP